MHHRTITRKGNVEQPKTLAVLGKSLDGELATGGSIATQPI
jgi:hypothetical protein